VLVALLVPGIGSGAHTDDCVSSRACTLSVMTV